MEASEMLKRYLESGSSADFERIVRANGSLVFGTAMRSTRSRTLAEEVTQEVFITLARKASGIREPHKLAGWLHRTTLHCAANINRREAKRRKAMEAYSLDATTPPAAEEFASPEEEVAWQRALPMLDGAIDKLPETDREAVMQRFFEKASYKQIGKAVGKSEDASRKQVGRALEKLARFLKRKGLAVPTTALGVGLGACFTKEVLPIATEQLTRIALAAKPALLNQTLAAMSAYKLTIVAAATAALMPIGVQLHANQSSSPAAKQGDSPAPSGVRGAVTSLPTSALRRTAPRGHEELHAAMQEIFAIDLPSRASAKIDHLLMGLGRDELQAALTALHAFPTQPSSGQRFFAESQLFARWAYFDPKGAFETAQGIDEEALRRSATQGTIEGWVERDLSSLDAFIATLEDADQRRELENLRWVNHSQQDPAAAAEMALKIEDSTRRMEVLETVVRRFVGEDPWGCIVLIGKLERDPTTEGWLDTGLRVLSTERPEEAFAESMRLLDGNQRNSTVGQVMKNWARADPAAAFEALRQLPEEMRSPALVETLSSGLVDLSGVESRIEALGDAKLQSAMIAGVADGLTDHQKEWPNVTPEGIAKVRALVETLPAGEDRFSARWDLAEAWASIDYGAAHAWYRSQADVNLRMVEKFVKMRKP